MKPQHREAHTAVVFQALEEAGRVRLRWQEDHERLDVDDFDETQREEIARLAEAEGVWGLIAEFQCPLCRRWKHSESVWAMIGQDDGGYAPQFKRAAIHDAQKECCDDCA